MEHGPGSATFCLVAWTMRKRIGRWSFWRRGTGETMMQHHCTGREASEPVDRESHGSWALWHCRGCNAGPHREIKEQYLDKKAWA